MDFIDMLSIFLPALASFSVLVILFINIYRKLRPNKFVRVNCWFCNKWSKVCRELQNSWNCPFCEQYNGFTKDGDYNKLIPEQHDEFMNKVPTLTSNKTQISDNGLCGTCNNNQQLKIQQLAMFSPIDEDDFDEEIERYQKQLERAYRLCPQCEKVLKKTLHKEKSILLGLKLSTIRKKGFNLMNLNTSSSGISKTAKKTLFLTAIRYTTIILATIRVFQILRTCKFSEENIMNALPATVVPHALLIRDIVFLLYKCGTSMLELTHNLQAIFWQNFLSIFDHYIPFATFEMIQSITIRYNINFISLYAGFFLQTVFVLLNNSMHLFEIAKCLIWLFLSIDKGNLGFSSNLKLLEIILCNFIMFYPSSIQKSVKITKCTFKNEFAETTNCDNVDLLNSTFKSDFETSAESKNLFIVAPQEKIDNPFNVTPLAKVFNSPNKNESVYSFGKEPVFGNPLQYSFSDNYRSGSSAGSFSTKKSLINDSLNSSYYENLSLPSKENSPNKSSEQDWYKGLDNLHLSSPKKYTGDEIPAAFRVSSPILHRPKPVLSPPKLSSVTQSSWVAGGYWKNDFFKGSYSNLSRSSSQSSGFGSQSSHQPNMDNFNSLPSSRTNSICGEYDRFSVLSEPIYYAQNRFYANLRPDQQLFICPNPKSTYVSQRLSKSPTNFVLNDNLSRENSFISSANSSVSFAPNQSFGSPSFNVSNPFYSNMASFGANNVCPLSVNSNNSSVSSYEKGSLLQKWRDRNC